MTQILFSAFSFFFATATLQPNLSSVEDGAIHDFQFGYSMESPDKTFELDSALDEISGLTLSADARYLLANNDELGIVYFLNKETGEIVKELTFQDEGDYEGIEIVGNKAFIVKSKGTIYEIEDINAPELKVNKYGCFLTKENDVEALGYDAKNNRLLMGCKGKSGDGEEYLRKKAVFAFDLVNMKLIEEPIFMVTLEDVCSYLGACSLHREVLDNLNEFFNPQGEILNFSPSSLAIHPITGHIYITSSKGKMILVLDAQGKVLHIEKLQKSLHPQPEGLCFEKDGTMWISNEAKKDAPARLYKFAYKL